MPFVSTAYIYQGLRPRDGDDQSLQIRFGHVKRLISRSPLDKLPYEILKETCLFPLGEITLPLPLRKLEDPQLCYDYVSRFMSSENLPCFQWRSRSLSKLDAANCDKIACYTSQVVELLAARNYDAKFCLEAEINHIELVWRENNNNGERSRSDEVVEETVAPASKRLKKEKFDCIVCHEELNDEENEVIRIGCGHVYHNSCILSWSERRKSCPLCRRKIHLLPWC